MTRKQAFGLHRWSPNLALVTIGMIALAILATYDAWADIVTIAVRDEEASHIFLVPIVVVWLVWVRAERLRRCKPRPWVGGFILGLAGAVAFTIGYNQGVQYLWHAGALLVVLGAFLSVIGPDAIREFMPALAVLIFLLPVPGRLRQEIALPMGAATAYLTQAAFDLMGIIVVRSGNALNINNVPVLIAEACNGLRMVFALVLVSYVFAFGMPLRPYVRVLILAASPVSAILANLIRLIPTLWLYGYYPRNVAVMFHDYSGWVMLPIAFLMLLGIIRVLRWALVPVTRYTLAYG